MNVTLPKINISSFILDQCAPQTLALSVSSSSTNKYKRTHFIQTLSLSHTHTRNSYNSYSYIHAHSMSSPSFPPISFSRNHRQPFLPNISCHLQVCSNRSKATKVHHFNREPSLPGGDTGPG